MITARRVREKIVLPIRYSIHSNISDELCRLISFISLRVEMTRKRRKSMRIRMIWFGAELLTMKAHGKEPMRSTQNQKER